MVSMLSEQLPELSVQLPDEAATEQLGRRLHAAVAQSSQRWVVFLHGDLGAGKTTLVRGFMRGYGYEGAVKSPTFTLVEPYETPSYRVYHFDLYRLVEPDELEFVGLNDYLVPEQSPPAVVLIEWPERGLGALPDADIEINLSIAGKARCAHLVSGSAPGAVALDAIRGETGDG